MSQAAEFSTMKHDMRAAPLMLADLVTKTRHRKKAKRFWSFGLTKPSEAARARNAYLDQRIKAGDNLIRPQGLK
jgi:hypothetical protein